MRRFLAAVLYTALILGANAAAAQDIGALEALRAGSMKKLAFLPEAVAASQAPFLDENGSKITLTEFRGKWVLLNFWATWCAPCRKEMPGLEALQREMGGERFQVVTIATGRNPPPAIARFFDEIGVSELPRYRDPSQRLAREMAVFGLPTTVILDPEGREIARLLGDAEWDSDSARAIIAALVGAQR
ncbi:Thiol-disulfide isomerase or thioredoxin [Meinhardsimonia xiamenensis]|jgi:thiol-disulfide isomerase/thioredoxin|uniref:Thiol-disulfide isomerase or thioredoxin n=1 Tax=Meinhardsimonia xiamenensis TaxID=990712 RepID=A0A1G8YHK0_9RHOB|nr:TlpA disulfide reductase family protein [Meinhardsimonia xiamenensis]PRX37309.1 thiol-disulfide isomerase/thioredoxin [Meinhardsimonia xiamenensis]SDK02342.1 Thiol-disulfide isomerase or thioredoxin [Meinhardsimonia xiamenensis]